MRGAVCGIKSNSRKKELISSSLAESDAFINKCIIQTIKTSCREVVEVAAGHWLNTLVAGQS